MIPSHQIILTWQNLSARAKDKFILQDSTGYCKPGQMLAIMGPSGAGKTTLLSMISGKIDSTLKISGKVEANKNSFTRQQFYNFAGFVFQNDILHQTLTVRETLLFSARLKIGNEEDAISRVEELIQLFELQKCADTYVGGKIVKGISGGQKKRVCIALETMNKPSVLILDEPTSGLDSHIAGKVVQILKKLAKQGKTIVFTIHQPSFLLYSLLDRLILLDKGLTIYQGKASEISQYISSLNIKIPQKTTICDFFMMEISAYKAKKQNYITPFNASNYQKLKNVQVNAEIKDIHDKADGLIAVRNFALSRFRQFVILFQRQLLVCIRNPMKAGRIAANAALTIVIVGLIFLFTISDNKPSQDEILPMNQMIFAFIQIQGAFFVSITSNIMNGIFTVALVFPAEREVFAKQSASKTYSTLPYFISKLFIQLIILQISCIIYASGVYWLIGCDHDFVKFIKFVLLMCMVGMIGNSLGLMVGSLFKDAQRSTSLSPIFILPLMMFSGLYNKLNSIPNWIAWMQYVSPFRYGLHSLVSNQFGDVIFQTMTGPYDYKEDLGISESYSINLVILLSLSIFFYFLAYLFLKRLSTSLST